MTTNDTGLPATEIIEVFHEVDGLIYQFPTEESLALWAEHGDESFTGTRPATAADIARAGDEIENFTR